MDGSDRHLLQDSFSTCQQQHKPLLLSHHHNHNHTVIMKVSNMRLLLVSVIVALGPNAVTASSAGAAALRALKDMDYRYFVAGGTCAAISHGITTPIDVVKTRIQANPKVNFFGRNGRNHLDRLSKTRRSDRGDNNGRKHTCALIYSFYFFRNTVTACWPPQRALSKRKAPAPC
jgi:hypothetical protein